MFSVSSLENETKNNLSKERPSATDQLQDDKHSIISEEDSAFEEPMPNDTDWIVTTDLQSEDQSVKLLLDKIVPLIANKKS